MRRATLAFISLFAALPALAQPFRPCPYFSAGWSQQYSGSPITSVLYDQQRLILTVLFGTTPSVFVQVPLGVMQGFMNTKDPVGYYNSFVAPTYHSLLLFQTDNCPVLFENGAYIWTK
jgi:hypothetical protein